MGGPWGELPAVPEPWPVDLCPDCGRADCMGGGCPPSTTARSTAPEPSPNAGRVGRCVCPASDPCGACPDDLPDVDDYDEWANDPAEWARKRPDKPMQVCSCPRVYGMIHHDRDVCTDPVVVRLDWFPQ